MAGWTTEDRSRVEEACRRRGIGPTDGLFRADSLTRRVHRELALLGGGGCALLLQVAHPLVAAGVAEHSHFRRDPIGRLVRTLDLMLTLSFASAESALRAVKEIERRHARVQGRLAEAVGRYPAGTPYDAMDPSLLLWVHATLVATAPRVFERLVAPLSRGQRQAYYEESRTLGRLLGIPDAALPPDLLSFRDYFHGMETDGSLAVGPAARDIAAAVLQPREPWWLGWVVPPLHLLTAGLLPPSLRRAYGLPWSARHRQVLGALEGLTRATLPLLPPLLREFPQSRDAAGSSAAAAPFTAGDSRSGRSRRRR